MRTSALVFLFSLPFQMASCAADQNVVAGSGIHEGDNAGAGGGSDLTSTSQAKGGSGGSSTTAKASASGGAAQGSSSTQATSSVEVTGGTTAIQTTQGQTNPTGGTSATAPIGSTTVVATGGTTTSAAGGTSAQATGGTTTSAAGGSSATATGGTTAATSGTDSTTFECGDKHCKKNGQYCLTRESTPGTVTYTCEYLASCCVGGLTCECLSTNCAMPCAGTCTGNVDAGMTFACQ